MATIKKLRTNTQLHEDIEVCDKCGLEEQILQDDFNTLKTLTLPVIGTVDIHKNCLDSIRRNIRIAFGLKSITELNSYKR